MTSLDELAAYLGIEPEFRDARGELRPVENDVRRGLLTAFGLLAGGKDAAASSLPDMRDEDRRLVPPVVIIGSSDVMTVPVTAPVAIGSIRWLIHLEGGGFLEGSVSFQSLERSRLPNDEACLECRRLTLSAQIGTGYHRLRVEAVGIPAAEAILIVTPGRCFFPNEIETGRRVWGISLQLYLLKSRTNWGIGDFSDLKRFVAIAADLGADVVGLNPLHAMFIDSPEHASPYSPASRLFLNVLYIDVTAVAGFDTDGRVRSLIRARDFRARLATCRDAPLVDYRAVARLKFPVLEALHASFSRGANASERQAFERFRAAQGASLRKFCVFQALREYFFAQDPASANWRTWPSEYQDAESSTVAEFAARHEQRIDFLTWSQWIADTQLAEAASMAKRQGMAIGLYRDLAVGADAGGAETWSDPDLVLPAVHVGAPPDILNPGGQDWGLPPFHPHGLRRAGYQGFIDLIRANMRHAGGLRIDHVMALQRLYLIPKGSAPSCGAYVSYPLEDLLGILALESERSSCLVVGEDLGTVPEGFRERMEKARVFSYRVVVFETRDGEFIPPDQYPALALATLGSHDLATLRGWWEESDIDLKSGLGLYPEGAENDQRAQRAKEKEALLRAVDHRGAEPPLEASIPSMPPALGEAVHRLLAETRSGLAIVQLDDMTEESQQVNLPGTSTEHPNWRRKFSVTLEDLNEDPRVRCIADIMNNVRAHATRGT